MPAPPRTIGRYAVIDRLGQGGMGVVYRAWDPDLRRQVAIKVISATVDPGGGSPVNPLNPVDPVDDDLFERFVREAQAAASLAHPNIVTIFDFGRHGGRPYIVMELIDGESLAQVIHQWQQPQRGEGLSLAGRVRLAIDLCEGLAFAHEQGIVHRDVKPANIMLSASSGGLKIVDFGIARITDELAHRPLTQTGGALGTPQYMSPEQVLGEATDARSDVFSVGAVLYELFTGRPAFAAPTPAMVPVLVLQQPPPPMTDVPLPLEQVVARAMEKDPSRRFQRLDDVAARLRDWLRDAGELERDPGADEGGDDRDDQAAGAAPPGGSGDLGGLLAQWEVAVGQALDDSTPPPTPAVAAVVSQAPVSSPAPAAVSAVSAVPITRPGARSDRWIVAALAVAALLGIAGAYWLVAGNAVPEPRREPPSAVAAPPAAVPVSPPAPTAVESSAPPSVAGAEATVSPPTTTTVPAPTPATVPAAGAATQSGVTPRARRAAADPPVRESASPPAPARPLAPGVRARCTEIVQRVGLGEELTAGDREFLNRNCRDRSP